MKPFGQRIVLIFYNFNWNFYLIYIYIYGQTDRHTDGHGDSMTDPAQRAESVQNYIKLGHIINAGKGQEKFVLKLVAFNNFQKPMVKVISQ